MGPVLSREVIKGEQPLFVFFQAVGCFWVLGLVTGDELIISLQSGFSCRRQIHFVDELFGGDWEKPGAKEGGGTDLALLCPPRTAVPLDTSMGTEAEAIQSSPRFFLVSRSP